MFCRHIIIALDRGQCVCNDALVNWDAVRTNWITLGDADNMHQPMKETWKTKRTQCYKNVENGKQSEFLCALLYPMFFFCQKGHTTWILTGPESNFLRFALLAQVLGPQKLLQKSLKLLWMLLSVNQTTTWGLLLWFLVKDYFRDEKCLENETMLCSCTSMKLMMINSWCLYSSVIQKFPDQPFKVIHLSYPPTWFTISI